MMESNLEQPKGSRTGWFKSENIKLMSLLKKYKKIHINLDGVVVYTRIKPQDHGIKKALLERPLIADTSVILQNLIIDILYTTTEKNVKELIVTAMKKIKWQTELFTKQLEKRIAEAEFDDKIIDPVSLELTEEEEEEVKERDGYACLCCGLDTERKLLIDHIKPISMGGKISVENSQILCVICNRCKGNNEMDFRCNTTKLSIPQNLDLSFRTESQKPIRTLTRIVNLFYHCKAVYKIQWEVCFYTYTIYLYPGNNPEWLLQHKAELLKYVQGRLGRDAYSIHVTTTE